jgi:hypothetical protein
MAPGRRRISASVEPSGLAAAAVARVSPRVVIEAHPVECHDDDFATVVRAGRDLIVLVHVGYGEGHVGDVSVLEDHARPLHLVPMVHGAVRVTEYLLRASWIVGQSLVRPVVDAVGRRQMIADTIVRVVVKDVVLPTAEPDHGILGERIGGLDRRRCERIEMFLPGSRTAAPRWPTAPVWSAVPVRLEVTQVRVP